MLTIKTALFLSCVGLVVSFPGFFLPPEANPEGGNENAEQPLRAGDQPQFQMDGSPSYEYDGAGADPAPGGSTSEEVSAEGGTGVLGAAGGETAGGDTAEVDSPDAAENGAPAIGGPQAVAPAEAGGNSGAVDSPAKAALNTFDGGPGSVKKGEKSTTGRNAGIAVGVIGAVGLAAGVGFYVYRKKRAAAYGARF